MKPDSSSSTSSYKYFNQTLDHFNESETRTFSQRYVFEDKWYKHSHMMFVYISGESTMSTKAVTNKWVADLAERYGAYAAALEHRYYGESTPFTTLTTENLTYLSSRQALADLASFIEFLKEEYKSDDIYKIIVIGGSYAGCLAGWFRQLYPHLALGAISSSGPFLAKEDFYEYDQAVSDALDDDCRQVILDAVKDINTALETEEGYADLLNQTGCTIEFDYRTDVAAGLSDAVAGEIQYNKDYGSEEEQTKKNMCKALLNTSVSENATVRYLTWYRDYLANNGYTCDDWSSTKDYNNTDYDAGGSRQWTYQTCTEFGYFQVAPENNSLRASIINVTYYENLCEYAFNISGDTVNTSINATNNFYHDRNSYATNVAFTNGENDPWMRLSITPGIFNDSRYNDNRQTRQRWLVQQVEGGSHCTELYSPTDDDTDSLTSVRENIIDEIDAWLEWQSLDREVTTSSPIFLAGLILAIIAFIFCAASLIGCVVVFCRRRTPDYEKM